MTALRTLMADVAPYATKTDVAYSVLREAILSGVLAPGAAVHAKSVADELGMSFIPVREALRRLEQDGLVSIRPHVGTTVRELDADDIEETMLMRSELEALATRLAAEGLDDRTLATLEVLVDAMDECVRDWNPERFGILNREFHLTLYRSSPYQRIYHQIESLWDQVPRARSVFALVPDYMAASQAGHHQLLAALRRRDGRAAERLMRDQKNHALDSLLAIIRGQDLSGASDHSTAPPTAADARDGRSTEEEDHG
jgi:DNA-binding GntR family transcriptional regulator